MKTCITGKKMYLTQSMAEDVLIETCSRFEFASGSGPIAVYRCDDCGYYHLTSRGPMNERLAKFIADGKLSLEREANRWIDKLKRR